MENERPLNERFIELESRMSDAHVLLDLGKANELPFFIFDYDPVEELKVREEIIKLKKNNPNIQEFDLFNIVIELLKNEVFRDSKNMRRNMMKNLVKSIIPAVLITRGR